VPVIVAVPTLAPFTLTELLVEEPLICRIALFEDDQL